jgi:divalent metal cation (Fe/Co/Zn/Cd) transporter
MITTLIINVGVNRYEAAQGKRLKSEVLIADAAHTGADIFVTLSVLVSMGLIVVFRWYWMDTVTAVVVVVLIGRTAWKIVQRTGSILVDTAPFTPEQLTALALQTQAVTGVARARSRGSFDAATIDIDLRIAPETTADRSAAIALAVEENLRSQLPGIVEVNVQFLPTEPTSRDYHLLSELTAEALGLDAHHIYLNQSSAGDVLELHVEVPPGQTLDQAHELASQLETALKRRLPELAGVVTHIEPAPLPISHINGVVTASQKMTQHIFEVLRTHYPEVDWHDLHVFEQPRGAGLTLHATLTPELTIEEAHDLAAAAERLLRTEVTGLDRITIHTEPA